MSKLIPKGGNDKVFTPQVLANEIVMHFKPWGRYLEPCYGDGVFIEAILNYGSCHISNYCEIDMGLDFLNSGFKDKEFDWIITNPPYSLYRKFLKEAMRVAQHIVFLSPINHVLGLKARLRDINRAGFYIRELALIDTPKSFPSSGFQYAAIYLNQKMGNCKITKLKY